MRTSALRVIALLMLPGLASAGSFTPLEGLGIQAATALSADGTTVVGTLSGGYGQAFRWSAAGGVVGLGDLPGGNFESTARGVSGNGEVVVGYSASQYGTQAFRWTSAGGMVGLGDLPGGSNATYARDVSADGSVVIVDNWALNNSNEAFLWTANGTLGLGYLPSAIWSQVGAISVDGSTVVGGSSSQAFRWTSGGGMVGLGDLPGGYFYSRADAVSADGSTVVGASNSGGATTDEAFRWTSSGGMVGLGDLPGGLVGSQAQGVSADGSVVVGASFTATSMGNGNEAFIWTEATGMQRLFDVLVAQGATGLSGWTLASVSGISADGLTILGTGYSPLGTQEAFLAHISPVPIPPAVWLFGSALGLIGVMRRKLGSQRLPTDCSREPASADF